MALDLGCDTGYACSNRGRLAFSGAWALNKLAPVARGSREDRICDPRVLKLRDLLRDCVRYECPDWLVFEDVQFSKFTLQTQLWSSFRTVVWLQNAIHECCPVGTLKKFATGHGGATKDMMLAAIPKKYPDNNFTIDSKGVLWQDMRKVSDDEADALHLLAWMNSRFH